MPTTELPPPCLPPPHPTHHATAWHNTRQPAMHTLFHCRAPHRQWPHAWPGRGAHRTPPPASTSRWPSSVLLQCPSHTPASPSPDSGSILVVSTPHTHINMFYFNLALVICRQIWSCTSISEQSIHFCAPNRVFTCSHPNCSQVPAMRSSHDREILHIQGGQCGNQIRSKFWAVPIKWDGIIQLLSSVVALSVG
jgi:hypothetical protein